MPDHTADGNNDNRRHVATVEEYARYLAAHRLKPHQIRMLRANAIDKCTATELAEAAGWSDYSAANLHYGALGKHIGQFLGLVFQRYDRGGKEFFVSAIAEVERVEGPNGKTWAYKLHQELRDALGQLGIV